MIRRGVNVKGEEVGSSIEELKLFVRIRRNLVADSLYHRLRWILAQEQGAGEVPDCELVAPNSSSHIRSIRWIQWKCEAGVGEIELHAPECIAFDDISVPTDDFGMCFQDVPAGDPRAGYAGFDGWFIEGVPRTDTVRIVDQNSLSVVDEAVDEVRVIIRKE